MIVTSEDTVYKFMLSRQKTIFSGGMAVDPVAQGDTNRNGRRQACNHRASVMAQAEPSDPFAYSRTKSLLYNGVASPYDFHVDFEKETRINPITGTDYTVMAPRNMRRP